MNILTVVKATIAINDIEIDAYTANEISSVTGGPINYLSGRGLAKSIGATDFTTRSKSLPDELKVLLGTDFTTRSGRYKNESGAYSKINLWDTTAATRYYYYHAMQGNQRARAIMLALTATSLDIIINDRLNREYQRGQAEAWTKARARSKDAFWSFGDAIKQYVIDHPERSDMFRKFVYSNCQDCLNRGLFGKSAKTIREELGVPDLLRDHYGEKALHRIDLVQSLACSFLDSETEELEPLDALKKALAMFNYDEMSFKD